jgi:hypothetical protein
MVLAASYISHKTVLACELRWSVQELARGLKLQSRWGWLRHEGVRIGENKGDQVNKSKDGLVGHMYPGKSN